MTKCHTNVAPGADPASNVKGGCNFSNIWKSSHITALLL